MSAARPLSRRSLFGLAFMATAGCSILPDVNEPVPLYNLMAPIRFDVAGSPIDRHLSVGLPVASADLDSARIALSRQPGIIEYFGNGQWADHAPSLLQARLIEAFEIHGAIAAVDRDTAGISPDVTLHLELRDFQVEYEPESGRPVGHVRMAAKLFQLPQRRMIHFQQVDQRVPAGEGSLRAVTYALDQAASLALADIVLGVAGALR